MISILLKDEILQKLLENSQSIFKYFLQAPKLFLIVRIVQYFKFEDLTAAV